MKSRIVLDYITVLMAKAWKKLKKKKKVTCLKAQKEDSTIEEVFID